MPAPWSPAVPGQGALSGQINQFLTAHVASFLYAGSLVNAETIGGSPAADNLGAVKGLAYRFQSPGSVTQLTRVSLALGAIGPGTDVLMTLQGDTGGAGPDGTVLASCIIPAAWLATGVQTSAAPVHGFPLVYTMAALTYYNIVLEPIGTILPFGVVADANDVELTRSTSSTGAWTFNGVTWTAKTYGYGVNIYTGSTGALTVVSEDTNSLMKGYDYTAGLITTAREWASKAASVPLNLLAFDDAEMIDGLGSWVAASGCTAAFVSTPAATHASGSVKVDVVGTPASCVVETSIAYYPVLANTVYSALASVSCNGGTPRRATLSLAWYDGTSTFISSSAGQAVTEPTTGFTTVYVQNVTSPVNAAYVAVVVTFTPTSGLLTTGELHYVSAAALFQGSLGVWSSPSAGISSVRTLTYTGGLLTSVT